MLVVTDKVAITVKAIRCDRDLSERSTVRIVQGVAESPACTIAVSTRSRSARVVRGLMVHSRNANAPSTVVVAMGAVSTAVDLTADGVLHLVRPVTVAQTRDAQTRPCHEREVGAAEFAEIGSLLDHHQPAVESPDLHGRDDYLIF